MNKHITIFLFFLIPLISMGKSLVQSGDSAYQAGNYKLAKDIYENVLSESKHPDIYYNLGNAEYRLNHLPHAILNYRRALKLQPNHAEAKNNLELCELKQHISFDRPDEMFFFTFYRNFKRSYPSNVWASWSIAFFVLLLFGTACYLCLSRVGLRKLSFAVALLALVGFCLTAGYAHEAKQRAESTALAVVMNDVEVKSSPSAAAKTNQKLLPGTTVEILSEEGEWINVKLPDATEGWISTGAIEIV